MPTNRIGGRLGIDTNVLIYALNEESSFHDQARKLLASVAENTYFGIVCWQNLTEFYAIVTDKRRFPRPLLPSEAMVEIKKLFEMGIEVIGANQRARAIWSGILKVVMPKGQQVHDTFLAATFLSHGVDILVTENKADFEAIKNLKVLELSEF